MKNTEGTSRCLALFLLVGFALKPTGAPWQSPRALAGFGLGLAENAPQKQVAGLDSLQNGKTDEELEHEYIVGMAALRVRDWTRAIHSFQKVVEMNPAFRDARRRLNQARYWHKRESREVMLARYYAEGVLALNRNDLDEALVALEKVHKIDPNYRDTAALLAEVKSGLTASSAAPLASPANLDSLYQEALAALAKEDWMQAVFAFEKIQLLQPGYRDVADRLRHARERVRQAKAVPPRRDSDGNFSFYVVVGSALAALVVLPLLGAIAFSPATRARACLLQGKYVSAAQLYEKILERSPDKVKLYPTLANIYLVLGRKDEKALKVFKTVLQLNLASRNREEINSIVAQKYLTEGRTDSDAIEVLENALQAERRKLAQVYTG